MSASALIADVLQVLRGMPVFLAGSLVAEEAHGKSDAHSDIDVFCPTPHSIMVAGQSLLEQGYKADPAFERVWQRWVRMGFKSWHTNSMRMVSPTGIETNLVYKLTDGHPTTSLAQVLESFDFGLLGMGYEVETGTYRDMRPYLFPGFDINGPLPMMPNKEYAWRNGFISQYNGIREFGRYVKYHQYGYDMSLVKDILVEGYYAASIYLQDRFEPEKQQLGAVYFAVGQHIESDNIDQLAETSRQVDYTNPLDSIMDHLE